MNGKISNFAQVASLRRYTYVSGKEKGIEVIDCDNGKLRFLLNVTKALDIMQLYHCGQNVSFLSKNAFTPREIPFGERFEGGMVYTCGLNSLGHREGFELHGNLHNTNAQVVCARCDEDGIYVEAIVESTELFGKNLVFRRKIFSAIGSESLKIEDTLENRGFRDEDYCLLYHINVGYPMLDEGGKIEAEMNKYYARSEWAKENEGRMFDIVDSIPNDPETCYFLDLKKPCVSLTNSKLGKKFTVSYSGETLPCFIEWHSMASRDYALGLEPSTSMLDSTFEYKKIAPEEKVNFTVELSVNKI